MDFTTGILLSAAEVSADATNNHSFTNTAGDVFLIIENGHTATVTITVLTPQTITSADLTVEDPEFATAAGETRLIGPFPPTTFNQTDGKVYFDIDVDTATTISAIQHGPSA